MEAIFCHRFPVITPSKRQGQVLAPHTTSNLAPLGHLSFPRSALRHQRRLSCSRVPPPPPPPPKEDGGPKGRVGGRKGARVAAAGAAMALAYALGAVYLSRAPVVAAQGAALMVMANAADPGPTQDRGSPTSDKSIVDIRDREKEQTKLDLPFADPVQYEKGIQLIHQLIQRKDYHLAKNICKFFLVSKTIKSDARPHLLMAVINMMLTVENMLISVTSRGESEALIKYEKGAKTSWENFKDVIRSYPPDPPTEE